MNKIILTNETELEILIQRSIKKAFKDQSAVADSGLPIDKILTIGEAADFLNLAIQTLYGFTSKREIPFMKRGKRLYFKESELVKWLEEGKQKSVSEILAIDAKIDKKKRG